MTHKLYSEIQYTFSHPIKRCGNIELAHCHFLLKQVRWRCCLGAPEDWTLSCLCVWRRNKLWGHFSPHSWLKFSFCHLFFHTYSSFIIPLLFLSFFFFINHPCFFLCPYFTMGFLLSPCLPEFRAVIHIQVDDVNEFSPVFRESLYKASVTEGKIYDSILQVFI